MTPKIEVDAVELKTIELRLNAVKEATHRSRAVFLVMTVVCAMILFGLWNAIVSWERELAKEKISTQDKVKDNQKTATDEWIKNLYVSVSLLGIKVSTNDLAVTGSLSLVIITVWFFFVQRRENRAIVSLLQYCAEEDEKKALSNGVFKLVYEGIAQNIVFIDMGGGDKEVEGLKPQNNAPESNQFTRWILTSLTFLPPFTIATIIASDLFSLKMDSYLRDDFMSVWDLLWKEGNPLKSYPTEIAKILFYEVIALLCFFYTIDLCRKCRRFSAATSRTIKLFKKELIDERDKKIIIISG